MVFAVMALGKMKYGTVTGKDFIYFAKSQL